MKSIYIVTSNYSSLFGNTVRLVKNGYWNHAGISLNKDLNPMYTFGRKYIPDANKLGGFYAETLDTICYDPDILTFQVLELKVDDKSYNYLEVRMKYLQDKVKSTNYNFKTLFASAFNIKLPDYYNMDDYTVCSVFVADLLSTIGHTITTPTNKPNNLITPDDVGNVYRYDRDFKLIYLGGVKDYKPKNIMESSNIILEGDINNPRYIQSNDDFGCNKIKLQDNERAYGVEDFTTIMNTIGNDVYIITDPHIGDDFNDRDSKVLIDNPGDLWKEKVDTIIKAINSKVSPYGHILCLGDLAGHHDNVTTDMIKYFLDRLYSKNFYLIIGNNDYFTMDQYKKLGIKMVTDVFTWKNIIFSHCPIEEVPKGSVNIHGHLHDSNSYFGTEPKGHYKLWDPNFIPIQLKDIEFTNYIMEADNSFGKTINRELVDDILKNLRVICKKYSKGKEQYKPSFWEEVSDSKRLIFDLTNMAPQEYIIENCKHISDIANDLSKAMVNNKSIKSISIGDGDEGCIYVKIKQSMSEWFMSLRESVKDPANILDYIGILEFKKMSKAEADDFEENFQKFYGNLANSAREEYGVDIVRRIYYDDKFGTLYQVLQKEDRIRPNNANPNTFINDDLYVFSDIHIGKDFNADAKFVEWINKIPTNANMLILGDIVYAKRLDVNYVKRIFSKIKCKNRYMIIGNHDILNLDYYYDDLGFKGIYTYIEDKERKIIFTHQPVNYNKGWINIHGHLHDDTDYYEYLTDLDHKINVYYKFYETPPTLSEILMEDNPATENVQVMEKSYSLFNGLIQHTERADISFSNSFSDVQKVVNALPRKDLNRICNGEFKESPYVIYREVLLINNEPVSFIEVYKLPGMKEDGVIVIATVPKWRNMGFSQTLISKMKRKLKGKNLVWKTQRDNEDSIFLAKKMKFEPMIENNYPYPNSNEYNKVPKSVTESYYRVTYGDEGIYQALKKELTKTDDGRKVWNDFLNNDEWLPKPPTYDKDNRSYFTDKGYNKFIKSKDYELMQTYLDTDNINITKSDIDDDIIIYSDKYQIVADPYRNAEYKKNFHNKSRNDIKYVDINKKSIDKYLADDPFFQNHVDYVYHNIKGELAIDKRTDEIAGYVFIRKDKGSEGFISPLQVYSQYRGYGIGSRLLDDALNKYDAQDLCVYKSNKVALDMYKNRGFVIVGYGNDGPDEYYMKHESKLTNNDKPIMESVPLETRLTTNPFESEMTLYHGSPDRLNIIAPVSFNAGTKLSRERTSSFWTTYPIAKAFAFFRLVESGGFYIRFSEDMNRFIIREHEEKSIIKFIRNKKIYIYEKTIPKEYLGIGHSDNFPEYTVDLPVKPDREKILDYNKFKDMVDNLIVVDLDDDQLNQLVNQEIDKMYTHTDNIMRKIVVNDLDYFLKRSRKSKNALRRTFTTEASSVSHLPFDIVAFNNELNSYDYAILINGKVVKDNVDFRKYKTIPINQFEKYHAGVCWDFVNYEAYWFKNHGYDYNTYYIQIDDNMNCPSHTFLIFNYNNKYYYFESSWNSYQGIEEFKTEQEAIDTVMKRHMDKFGSPGLKCYCIKYNTEGMDNQLTTTTFMDKVFKNGKEICVKTQGQYTRDDITSNFLEKGDTCYNLDKLDPNGYNILWITGIAGSGKTTLGTDLAKNKNWYRVEMDYIVCYYLKRTLVNDRYERLRDKVYKECPEATEFFDITPPDTYGYPEKYKYTSIIYYDFIKWFIPKVQGNGNIYIINGAGIPSIYEANKFYEKPLILKETNYFKTALRRFLREFESEDKSFMQKSEWAIKAIKSNMSLSYRQANKDFIDFNKDLNKNALLVESMKRSEMPDDLFGVPEQRKYQLDTKKHVLSAIKLFNWVEPQYEKELARNINAKIQEFNIKDSEIHITEKNRFYKYYKKKG